LELLRFTKFSSASKIGCQTLSTSATQLKKKMKLAPTSQFLWSSKIGASQIDILSFVMKLRGNYTPMPPLTQKTVRSIFYIVPSVFLRPTPSTPPVPPPPYPHAPVSHSLLPPSTQFQDVRKPRAEMGYLPSQGRKAAHLVSDLATIILNPVFERERQHHHPSHLLVSGCSHLLYLICRLSALLASTGPLGLSNWSISELNRVFQGDIGVRLEIFRWRFLQCC
jgi:hypothetical protein